MYRKMRLLGANIRAVRLFNKNLASCKVGMLSIASDFCTVSVQKSLVQKAKGLINGGVNHDPLRGRINRP